jgi:hypothetical protein
VIQKGKIPFGWVQFWRGRIGGVDDALVFPGRGLRPRRNGANRKQDAYQLTAEILHHERDVFPGLFDTRQRRFNDNIRTLRELLERSVGGPTAHWSRLFHGLEPYPDGWRASVPRPEGLPQYPMVLHRGFPDGS